MGYKEIMGETFNRKFIGFKAFEDMGDDGDAENGPHFWYYRITWKQRAIEALKHDYPVVEDDGRIHAPTLRDRLRDFVETFFIYELKEEHTTR